jgi:hypothetical protein
MHESSTRKICRVYEFIKGNRKRFEVRMTCRVLEVAPSGYYHQLQAPVYQRALEYATLLRLSPTSCFMAVKRPWHLGTDCLPLQCGRCGN